MWLSLEKEVSKRGGTSGRDELQIEQMVSDLFINRTRRVGKDGIRVPGAPFKYKRVAPFLSAHPKWERNDLGDGGNEKSILQDENYDEDCAGYLTSRPVGIKKKKEMEREANEKRRMRKEMQAMNEHLAFANQISLCTSKRDRREFLLSVIPKDTPEYAQLLRALYRKEICGGLTDDDDVEGNDSSASGRDDEVDSDSSVL